LPKRGHIVKTQTNNQNKAIDVRNLTNHQLSNHKNWLLIYNMSSNSIIFKGVFYIIFPHAIKTSKTWSLYPFQIILGTLVFKHVLWGKNGYCFCPSYMPFTLSYLCFKTKYKLFKLVGATCIKIIETIFS
jgi:hypothetical protein